MYSMGSNGRAALRDLMSLFRLTRRFGKALPALQILIILLHVYDFANNPIVREKFRRKKKRSPDSPHGSSRRATASLYCSGGDEDVIDNLV